MKRSIRVIISIILSLLMTLAFCSCGGEAATGESEIANPVVETSQEDVGEATGIYIDAPEGSSDVAYSYIDVEAGNPIAQVAFTLDGKSYNYRAQATDQIDIYQNVTGDADLDNLMDELSDGTNVGAALSGMYFDWECGGTSSVCERDAVLGYNEGKEGFVAWIDAVPGVMYCLSMDKDADQDILIATAEATFISLQGDE